jgi:hypothetical protein
MPGPSWSPALNSISTSADYFAAFTLRVRKAF